MMLFRSFLARLFDRGQARAPDPQRLTDADRSMRDVRCAMFGSAIALDHAAAERVERRCVFAESAQRFAHIVAESAQPFA